MGERQRMNDGYWYVCTPYTKYPKGLEAAFHDACVVTARLIRLGFKVFCPIAHTHPIAAHGFDAKDGALWLEQDRPLFDAATGVIVVMLDGWRESSGIQAEVQWAKDQGKPILYMEPQL